MGSPYLTPRLASPRRFDAVRARLPGVGTFMWEGPLPGSDMPAKALCPNCGVKQRGPAHICDPTRVEREQRRQAALAKLTQK